MQSFEELNVSEKRLCIGKVRTIRHFESWELLIESNKQRFTLQFGWWTPLLIPSATPQHSAAEEDDFVSCTKLRPVALPSIVALPDKVVGKRKALWRGLSSPPTPNVFASSELFLRIPEGSCTAAWRAVDKLGEYFAICAWSKSNSHVWCQWTRSEQFPTYQTPSFIFLYLIDLRAMYSITVCKLFQLLPYFYKGMSDKGSKDSLVFVYAKIHSLFLQSVFVNQRSCSLLLFSHR